MTAHWNRDMHELAAQFGARVERSKKNHYRFILPNGQIRGTSGTPGDYRVYLNTRAELRRASKLPPRENTMTTPAPSTPSAPPAAPPRRIVVAPSSAPAKPVQTAEPSPSPAKRGIEHRFVPLSPEERAARVVWTENYLRSSHPVPSVRQFIDAHKEQFGVGLDNNLVAPLIQAELERRGLAPRLPTWRPAQGDRPAALGPTSPTTKRRPRRGKAPVPVPVSAPKPVPVPVSVSAPKPAPKPAPKATSNDDFQAAVELLLAAVPNLARLVIQVGEDGEASVDYTTRVVQEQTGRFQVKGGK